MKRDKNEESEIKLENVRLRPTLEYQKAENLFVKQEEKPDLDDVYQKQFEKRKSFLRESKMARKMLLAASKTNNNSLFYEKISIEAFCPKLERVGYGDGGKFVCDAELARKGCVLLSLGLNNQINFEKDFQNRTGFKCALFGIDVSPQSARTLESYKKIGGKAYVGEIGEKYPIAKLLDESPKKQKHVDFLKIDIEGGEQRALLPFLENHFVCQIFVEIHFNTMDHMILMSNIANLGFRMFNFEPNPFCRNCCEFSYINELCMAEYDVIPLSYRVPLDLDY
ncbi:unnamed protein product [Caenorhabditis angaria]|uniref:Methyltransferase domain-containing protein n=1 Tax=Caenorhabditis angaria TaxID=860376 RepID=A0A9P1MVK3_9PELO|nr:unnamed protein product [Caenorhabditis angaria]